MKLLHFLFLSLLILFSSASFSAQFGTYDYDVDAFQDTRKLCQDDIRYLELTKFFVTGFETGASIWRSDSAGATPETLQLIHSDGFKAALYACFGPNQSQQSHFQHWVVGEEVAGHMLGTAVWFVPTIFLFKYLKWIRVMNKPLKVLSFANKIALIGLPPVIAYDYYTRSQVQAERKKNFIRSNKALADQIREMSDTSYDLLRARLGEINEQLAKKPLDVATENDLLHRKAIIEEKLKHQDAPERYVH